MAIEKMGFMLYLTVYSPLSCERLVPALTKAGYTCFSATESGKLVQENPFGSLIVLGLYRNVNKADGNANYKQVYGEITSILQEQKIAWISFVVTAKSRSAFGVSLSPFKGGPKTPHALKIELVSPEKE
jgi:hypothetical protein